MNHLNVRNLSGLSNGYFDSLDVAGNIIQYGGAFNTNEDISGYTILGQPSSYFTGITSNIQNQFYSIENQILSLNSVTISSFYNIYNTLSGSINGSISGSMSNLNIGVSNSLATLSTNNTITSNLSLTTSTTGITINLSSPLITRSLLQNIIGLSDADIALFAAVGGLGAAIIAGAILTGLAFTTIQAELLYLDIVAGKVYNMFDNMATNAIGIAEGLITYPIGEQATTFIKGNFKVGAHSNVSACLFMVDRVSRSTNAFGELKANSTFYVAETSNFAGNVSMNSNLTVATSLTCPTFYAPFIMKDAEDNYSIIMTSAGGISFNYSALNDPDNYHSFLINATGMSASRMTLNEITKITGNLIHTFTSASLCNLGSAVVNPTGFFFSNDGAQNVVQLNMIGTTNNNYANIYDAGITAFADIPNGNTQYAGFLKLNAHTLLHEGNQTILCNKGTTALPTGFFVSQTNINPTNTIQLNMISYGNNTYPNTYDAGIWTCCNNNTNGVNNGHQYLGHLFIKAANVFHTGQEFFFSMLNPAPLGTNDTGVDVGKTYIRTVNTNITDITNTMELGFKANPTAIYDTDCSIVVRGGGNNSVVAPQQNSGFMQIKCGSVNLAQCTPLNLYPTYIGAWNNNVATRDNIVNLSFKANPTHLYDSDASIWVGTGDSVNGALDTGAFEIKCGKLLLGQTAKNIQIGTSVNNLGLLGTNGINMGNTYTTTYFSGRVEFSGTVVMPAHVVPDQYQGLRTFINVAGIFRQF